RHNPTEIEVNVLKSTGADFLKTERGGQLTFHGPGQLVAYPIMDIRSVNTTCSPSIRHFVCNLENTIQLFLSRYNIPTTTRCEYPGVWIEGQNRKIASVGIHVRRWLTCHGVSINITNEPLKYFNQTTICGFPGNIFTSIQAETNRYVGIDDELLHTFAESFSKTFKMEYEIKYEM
ncbi:hypothetical protein ROZALSC1DRAFT_27477, partial [Rozella allomycis CSF55]